MKSVKMDVRKMPNGVFCKYFVVRRDVSIAVVIDEIGS